ncbi:MAG: penicillin-binding protein 1A [Polyangiales bacterium]
MSKQAAKSGSGTPKSSRSFKLLARLLVLFFFVAAAFVLGVVGVFSYYSKDLPSVSALRRYDPPQVSRVVDRKGRVIAEIFDERRTVVPMESVPRVLVLSVLAAEDADFYRHRGLDYAGILRALTRDVTTGKAMQGASTITQQIVKNLLLTPERTLARKVKELILARRLEQELSKDEILHLYLNHINFGHGRYGVQEAARFYFGKDVSQLDLAESSMLAGMPQAPGRLSPLRHLQAAKQRQKYVLDQLEAKRRQYWDDLSLDAIEKARSEPLALVGEERSNDAAPEVAAVGTQLLGSVVGSEAVKHGGYRVETTIDLELQRAARDALRAGLRVIDAREHLLGPLKASKAQNRMQRVQKLAIGPSYQGAVQATDDARGEIVLDVSGHEVVTKLQDVARFNPNGLLPSAFAPRGAEVVVAIDQLPEGERKARGHLLLGPEGAVVVIDPRTRDVLALVGGEKTEYGFDRALQAVRQPGSSFKAITYALALESGKYTPATLVLDAPEVFDKWKPDNFETWSYAGAVRLRVAVAQSINLVAVRVMNDLGPQKVVAFAKQLGITTPLDPSLALALGASEVRPIELVNAFTSFDAGGHFAPYRIVSAIRDHNGKAQPLPETDAPRQVLRAETAYVLTSVLRSVVEDGTGKLARKLGRPAAGKTGTSNDARDTWFVGYTPELVCGVWVGYDDHRPLGKGETGGKAAVPIWVDVMRAALGDRPAVEFPVPEGIDRVMIDPKTGLRAYQGMPNAFEEVFLAGSAPSETAPSPDTLDSGSFVMEQLGGRAAEKTP